MHSTRGASFQTFFANIVDSRIYWVYACHMASPAQIIALIFVILGLLSLIRWWCMGFPKKKYPLWPFVLIILAVWAILLLVAWFTSSQSQFREFVATCKGYLIGMFVMYIAMRAAGWKGGEK